MSERLGRKEEHARGGVIRGRRRGSRSDRGVDLQPGDRHYRAFVGPPDRFDLMGALQFSLLTALGLREEHYVLDIGCGSLRAGRLLIPYLLPGRYHGVEPERWLVRQGIAKELGRGIRRVKRPVFSHSSSFEFASFGRTFDFLMAQSVFSHAPVRDIRRCLREAAGVMDADSIFAATFFEGGEDYAGDEWVYPGCVRYKPGSFTRLVEEEGLACHPVEWPHPEQTWVLITLPGAPRPQPALVPAGVAADR